MTDGVPSDHASVSTGRAPVERSGGTSRPCVRLPDDVAVDRGDDVRVVLDGDEYHARVSADSSGLLLRGAYDLRSEARDPGGAANRLVEWLDEHDREPGSVVDCDEVLPGDCYGLRVPGTRAVYAVGPSPGGSLQDIADDLGE